MARLFDCSMLAAGLSLVLVAGFCLVESGGRFAFWFREVAGWLRCLLAGFDALSGRLPEAFRL